MFQLEWYRFLPFIGFHHVLMIIITAALIFLSILLGGCSSEGLASVYLASFSYQNSPSAVGSDPSQVNTNVSALFASVAGNDTSLEVRVGYLGICMLGRTGGWICSKSAADLASIVQQSASAQAGDPLNLLYIAQTVKDEIMFSGLLFISMGLAFIGLLGIATFPGWHEEEDEGSDRDVKPFPSRPVSQGALLLTFVASVIGLIAALWQHLGSAAVVKMGEALGYGTITGQVGATAMVFGWLGFALYMTSCIGLLIVILSIRVLAQLMDDE